MKDQEDSLEEQFQKETNQNSDKKFLELFRSRFH